MIESQPQANMLERADLLRDLPRAQIPRATYRLQFTKDFSFRQALALVDYFHALGVGACYASPILHARPGSTHGYDICDHSQLNPELGTQEDFDALTTALRERGMGLLVDIVPNHMGIGEACNAWWMDVLENGPSSPYASYFDISWSPVKPELENKVLLPILGDQYGNVLESGQLQLAYEEGAFYLIYFERHLPIAPRTYSLILTPALELWQSRMGEAGPSQGIAPASDAAAGVGATPRARPDEELQVLELQSILTALSHLPPRTEKDPDKIAERNRERVVIKRRLADLYAASKEFRRVLEETVVAINGRPGDPRSFDRLDEVVSAQAYRMAFWRVAAEEINYRRFFDINDMTAIRVELPEVFEATHRLILQLAAEAKITGLRVDHPDGLWAPADYFRRLTCEFVLRKIAAEHPELPRDEIDREVEAWLDAALERRAHSNSQESDLPLYVVAEKILSEAEPLPDDWAVYGTTGYDFANAVNAIFVDPANEKAFNRIYQRVTGAQRSYAEIVYDSKRAIMRGSLASEINSLAHELERISEKNRHYRDFTLNSITVVLREVIAALGIYRTYIDVEHCAVSERDATYFTAAVDKARRRNPALPASLFDFVRDTVLLRNHEQFPDEDRPAVAHFVMRLQQMTSPVMAKGVEDTAFYVYNRLVSLNEVGGNPAQFGTPLAAFHRHNAEHLRDWPHTLLATSTHDTKRSEDVRARIDVLSEMPDEWRSLLSRWRRLNQSKKREVDGEPAPDANDEYLLYQTLLGSYVIPGTEEEYGEYRERIIAYMQKAAKEAKVHTSWVNPNEAYDEAIRYFVARLLTDKRGDQFRDSMALVADRIAYFGRLNSLAQTLLKLTAPGAPDFYQGTELFDYSLVDPDNRRPVDYEKRKTLLAELDERTRGGETRFLELAEDTVGRSKLYLISRTLRWRAKHPALFAGGGYRPLAARGEKAEHAVAFSREREGEFALVITPRLVYGLSGGLMRPPLGQEVWKDTRILLPVEFADVAFHNLYTGASVTPAPVDGAPSLALGDVLCDFPVGLLVRV